MAAPTGNQFWKQRTKHGRDELFSTPEILWEACTEYLEWVDNNPLMASEVVKFQGVGTLTDVPKMRAMTLSGLCLYLDIDEGTWRNYSSKEDFFSVTSRVNKIIRTQKFEGAAADLLNANIIARDLGLRDKKDQAISGPDGGPIKTEHTDKTIFEIVDAPGRESTDT